MQVKQLELKLKEICQYLVLDSYIYQLLHVA